MKTIYTDTFGIRPIAWLALGAYMLASAIIRGTGWNLAIGLLGGAFFLFLAAKDFRRRMIARREGRDPAIVRVVEE